MGIKSINAFLLKKCPNAFMDVPITFLTGYRVAIDACNWVYKQMSVSNRHVISRMKDVMEEVDRKTILQMTANSMLSFSMNLLRNGTVPVWCWDGKSLPDKSATKEERRKAKEDLRNRIQVRKSELVQVQPISRNIELMNELRNLMCNNVMIAYEEMEYLKCMIRDLGFPCVQGENEGEKIAASLAIERKVIGVWSEDTDNYALGTPIMITGFNGHSPDSTPLISIVSLEQILSDLSKEVGRPILQSQFLDFCIMCGTDFNKNIPKIGSCRAWDLIKRYGTIDEITTKEPKHPFEILNYLKVRTLFTYSESKCDYNIDLDLEKYVNCKDYIVYYGLEHLYPEFTNIVSFYLRIFERPKNVQLHVIEPEKQEQKEEKDPLLEQIAQAEQKLRKRRWKVVSLLHKD